ncbi:MAG: SDR family oxidoreductase [Ilumatobacteraceae bacterium]
MAGTVLIAGASGLVGTAAVESFLVAGYDVIAASRRMPEVDDARPFRHLPLDLRDEAACEDAAKDLAAVTHVVYTAVYEKPGLIPGWSEPDQMETNLAMLRNLMEPLRRSAAGLQHVSLLQGTKAYGIHLHPMRIPGRERQPRDKHDNFYWLQEDYISDAAAGDGWAFSIWRPQLIVGPNYGVVMNLPPIIGAYAAVRREEGLPFSFPGGTPWVWEAVDTRLVANALVWGATSPNAVGETFNLTNGEVFEWRDLWPAMADELGVEVGPDEPVQLATYLPSKADAWDEIVSRHGLRAVPMKELVGESHHYADFCFGYGNDGPGPSAFVSTVKIKQAGFGEVHDTEETFRYWLRKLIERKILPSPSG